MPRLRPRKAPGEPTLFGETFPDADARETRSAVVTFPDRDPKITGGLAKKLKESRRGDALSVHAAIHFADDDAFRRFWDFLSRNSMVTGEVSARLGASSVRTFELTGLPRAVDGLLRQPGLLWAGLRPPRLPELDLFDFEVAPAHGKLEAAWIDSLRSTAPDKLLRVEVRFTSTGAIARRRWELVLTGAQVVDIHDREALIEGNRDAILKSVALSFVRTASPASSQAKPASPPRARSSEAGSTLLEAIRFESVDRRGEIVTLHCQVRSFGGTEPRHFTLRVEEGSISIVRTVPDVLEAISGEEAAPRWMRILLQTRALKPGNYRLKNPPGGEIEIR